MIIAGIIFQNGFKNSEKIKKIKNIVRRHSLFEENIIEKNNLFLMSGKISNNDFDVCLTHNNTVIIGRIFQKDKKYPVCKQDLDNVSYEKILSDYWGKYLFFHVGNIFSVFRDPTGQIPFFYCQLPEGALVFSSEIYLIREILGGELSYYWPYIASYIIHNNNSVSKETAFQDIYEVPPGCVLKYEKESKVESVWDPFQISKSDENSYTVIPNTLENVLQLWNQKYENIFLSFSGGLDSTSLLYCLKKTQRQNQTLKAINFFHPDIKSSDETHYAESVCRDLSVDLVKIDMSHYLPFSPMKNHPLLKLNKPSPMLTHFSLTEKLCEIINAQPSSLLISGQGGDHIFSCPPSETLLIDYLIERGLKGLQDQFKNISHYYRTSYYQVMKSALCHMLKYRFSKKNHSYSAHIEKWMTKDFKEMGRDIFLHPRYDLLSKKNHIGKFLHIESIDHALSSISLELGDHNPTFSPLLYQPLLEIALSIPVYDMLQEGYDRYPLRQSISKKFKTNHVWRRSKGETTGIAQLGLQKNLAYVQSLCLEGILSKEGFIKKDLLEQHLKSFSRGENVYFWSIMNIVSTEMFIDAWK
jgi:asparagine synthase (glutamine-hydrolysing)